MTNNIDFIISVTTFKERLKYDCLYNTLKNFKPLLDKQANVKYIVCIYKDDIKYITKNLYSVLYENNVEFVVTDEDLMSHKKYYYAMLNYKDIPIITIDDDVLYEYGSIYNLYSKYMKSDKTCIVANVCKYVEWNKPYREWKHSQISNSVKNLAIGYGGILYPPDILKISIDDLSNIRSFKRTDDLVLKQKENFLNVSVINLKLDKFKLKSVPHRDDTPKLCSDNIKTENDKTIAWIKPKL